MIEGRWRILAIAVIVFGLALWALGGVLAPFIAGILTAYVLDPVVRAMARRGMSRTVATTLCTLIFFALMIGAIAVAIPAIKLQLIEATVRLPAMIERWREMLWPIVDQVLAFVEAEHLGADVKAAAGNFAQTVMGWVRGFVGTLLSGGVALLSLLSVIFITPVVSFYLLRDFDRVTAELDSLLPRQEAPTIRRLVREIDAVLAAFLRGQSLVCLACGVFYAIALSAVNMPFGLAIGLSSGALVFIPYVGHAIGLIVSLAVAILSFGWDFWMILAPIVIFGVGIAVEGVYLTPNLVGDRVGLHPAWIIFSLLAGGALFGFVGVLVAMPVAAAVSVLVRFGIERYKASAFYGGGPTP
ncbi:MAG: AI-2E family transporter [Alphaproteobacteria bacterium]|nr:AI-2E family transporter [Alphaproteobacteria bacterium]